MGLEFIEYKNKKAASIEAAFCKLFSKAY